MKNFILSLLVIPLGLENRTLPTKSRDALPTELRKKTNQYKIKKRPRLKTLCDPAGTRTQDPPD